ncbi:hypothetical protein ACFU6K_27605 [Kitasatospora sp. NPDC057512]|uniref:hypothetical protein n=1 Tax=Kitasatospora sp. NPDC057512 TaxID=3346154 RepID=UPI0036D07832
MTDRIPPDAQGRWRGQRGRGTRGPNRVPRHPTMPLPDEVPAAEEMEDEMPQKEPSGSGNNGIGGPPPPPPAPRNPPPPNGNPNPPADPPK